MNYMYNGHRDVTALLGENGAIQATYYYDAFGNITYAGYKYDSETDLYYLNARYYDSKIARFISEDTYAGDENDPLSLNLYTYCHNEPVRYDELKELYTGLVDLKAAYKKWESYDLKKQQYLNIQLNNIYVYKSQLEYDKEKKSESN